MTDRAKVARIVMVGTSPKTMGGIATVVQGYTDAGLFEKVPMEYVVTHADGSSFQKFGVAIRGYLRILRILGSRRNIVFHVHMASRASFWRKLPVYWLSRLRRCPYIIHLHGAEFMSYYNNEAGRCVKCLIRNAFDHAGLILALSPEWRELVASLTRNPNIKVLPNSVPVTESVPTRSNHTGNVRILFLGKLGRRKGIYDLLTALSVVRITCKGFQLIAAGDGEIEEVRECAERLGLGGIVQVPGWIDTAAKQLLLANSDIFVLPSYAEGLPMSLLEAMSAGLPIICSTVGGIPMAVSNEREALLVAPGDIDALSSALVRLISNRDLRAMLGRCAHARAKSEFSIDGSVKCLIKIYADHGIFRHRPLS